MAANFIETRFIANDYLLQVLDLYQPGRVYTQKTLGLTQERDAK